MTTKQQIATGFLALTIVASVAFMPVSAELRETRAANGPVKQAAAMQSTSTELPQDQVRDLTYN